VGFGIVVAVFPHAFEMKLDAFLYEPLDSLKRIGGIHTAR
jgi:hypothetical protein